MPVVTKNLFRPMKKLIYKWTVLLIVGCGDQKTDQKTNPTYRSHSNENATSENKNSPVEHKKNPTDFLPKGFIVFERKNGDLNQDGIEDCVFIIKGTDEKKVIPDEYHRKSDRNRRGIIVLLNKIEHYELLVKNENCFSSENEDGGIYFPPELIVEIENGDLLLRYAHGRYGYWKYTFRYQHSDFELIRYDRSENRGPIVENEISIDFPNKKKLQKMNTNENAEGGDEVFKETSKNINVDKLIKLSEIRNFDELDMSIY